MYHGIIFNQGNALAMCSGKWVYIGHYSCYTQSKLNSHKIKGI